MINEIHQRIMIYLISFGHNARGLPWNYVLTKLNPTDPTVVFSAVTECTQRQAFEDDYLF